jgi:hypothetical protein
MASPWRARLPTASVGIGAAHNVEMIGMRLVSERYGDERTKQQGMASMLETHGIAVGSPYMRWDIGARRTRPEALSMLNEF